MKLVIRGDDIGYTPVNVIGSIKAMEQGLITHADCMLDCTGTTTALTWLKDHPYISTGWHSHMWGWPVADIKDVPSMVNDKGRFVGRKERWVSKQKDQIKYDEAMIELHAEMKRCIEYLGKPVDCGVRRFGPVVNDLNRALEDVSKEYNLLTGFMATRKMSSPDKELQPADEQYRHCHIFCVDPNQEYIGGYNKEFMGEFKYNPMDYYKNFVTKEMLDSDNTYVTPWHPGYLDEIVASESSMTLARVKDVEFLCSDEFKQWLVTNKVELVNMKDAIFGTRDYQNHLKAIGSPLYISR